jgi:hypothetical protein
MNCRAGRERHRQLDSRLRGAMAEQVEYDLSPNDAASARPGAALTHRPEKVPNPRKKT